MIRSGTGCTGVVLSGRGRGLSNGLLRAGQQLRRGTAGGGGGGGAGRRTRGRRGHGDLARLRDGRHWNEPRRARGGPLLARGADREDLPQGLAVDRVLLLDVEVVDLAFEKVGAVGADVDVLQLAVEA